jgi:hypothetical protein
MVLRWSPFYIVSDSPAVHSKWLLLLEIEISLVINFCFITHQNELNFNCSYMAISSLTYIMGFSVKFSFSRFLPIMQIRHILIKDHFKIVSDSSALHSRWLLLLKIEISSIVHCCFSISQNELNFFTAAT